MRSPVASQLVGDQPPGLTPLTLQQLADKAFGSPAVATRLDEDVDDVAILIDGTPEIVPLSLDGDEDLVQVPCVAQPGRWEAWEMVSSRPRRESVIVEVNLTTGEVEEIASTLRGLHRDVLGM